MIEHPQHTSSANTDHVLVATEQTTVLWPFDLG